MGALWFIFAVPVVLGPWLLLEYWSELEPMWFLVFCVFALLLMEVLVLYLLWHDTRNLIRAIYRYRTMD